MLGDMIVYIASIGNCQTIAKLASTYKLRIH
jgi:hypothetical protein